MECTYASWSKHVNDVAREDPLWKLWGLMGFKKATQADRVEMWKSGNSSTTETWLKVFCKNLSAKQQNVNPKDAHNKSKHNKRQAVTILLLCPF